jgi:hypothetical protein
MNVPGASGSETNGRCDRGKLRTGMVIFLIIVFAAGALHWVLFLKRGDLTFKAHDWGKEYIYYSVLRGAIRSGSLPYHIPIAFHDTNRFLALPETNLSPQILLLPFMTVGRFVLVNLLILYAIGYAGCLMIMRRYGLSPVAFAAMFMLFNFNGHITAHIGVGHSMWTAYFLLPFFFLFTVDIVQAKPSRTLPLKLGVVLFAITLQGGLHIYIWCTTFLVLLLIFNLRRARPVILAIVSGALLSSLRLIPAAFALAGKKEKFIWSYPTVRDMLDALVTIRQQIPDRLRPWGTPGWWEHDAYIGVIGLALIVYFGICLRFSRREALKHLKFKGLDLPLLIMSVFSLSYFHAFLTRLPLPLLGTERVATRFVIIPLVFLIFIASLRLDRILEGATKSLKLYVVSVAGLGVMAMSFIDHSFLWSLPRLERIYRDRAVDLTVPSTIALQDGSYRSVLLISWLVSAAAIAAVAYLWIRWRKVKGPAR